ncbi:hypothetical protein ANN_24557 [Periplaneta americana]|uniref:Uncharacterized protein n=1 Tax=Periplaneta americana TaxID=6978 RepID=A0ABQ8S3L9_PERAM|nr:hypothetical protein ANN_24557 [Periplaneta americana]
MRFLPLEIHKDRIYVPPLPADLADLGQRIEAVVATTTPDTLIKSMYGTQQQVTDELKGCTQDIEEEFVHSLARSLRVCCHGSVVNLLILLGAGQSVSDMFDNVTELAANLDEGGKGRQAVIGYFQG